MPVNYDVAIRKEVEKLNKLRQAKRRQDASVNQRLGAALRVLIPSLDPERLDDLHDTLIAWAKQEYVRVNRHTSSSETQVYTGDCG